MLAYDHVSAMRQEYFKNGRQGELDFEVPTSEDAHADPEREAKRSVLRMRGHSGSILENQITSEFRDRSGTPIVGQQ